MISSRREVTVAEWVSDMEDDPRRLWNCLVQLEKEKGGETIPTYITIAGVGREYVIIQKN